MKIRSSELVRYNANTRGTNTGDCSARAISLAFGMDYSKARKLLNSSAKNNRWEKYNAVFNVQQVLDELTGHAGTRIPADSRVKVDEFVDTHAVGTYVIGCSKGSNDLSSSHLVCCIDGKIYDSWDSRRYYVNEYWVVKSGVSGTDIVDIQPVIADYIRSLDEQYYFNIFDDILTKNRKLKKLADEYSVDIDLSMSIIRKWLSNFNFKFEYDVTADFSSIDIRHQYYEGSFTITFKPTLKPDQIEDYFYKTFYDKLYSFVHGIIDKIEDILESTELTKGAQTGHVSLYGGNYAMKCFNSLPYWVQKLATYFEVHHSSFDSSVYLTINRLPKDEDFGKYTGSEPGTIVLGQPKDKISFDAKSMDLLRKGLDHYKKTGNSYEATAIAEGYDI